MADSHEPSGDTGSLGIITELDVPATMRDGVTLRADVVRPEADGAFPGLLVRTPYGKFRQEKFNRFVRAGYVVVVQDSRGRYASDGDFVPFTVENTGDAEDGYDSVEWLAAQPYCNGRIGTMGYSYNGWMQWQLARLRPPHLLAMCACTIPLELTAVDWPGGFRPGRRIRWWMANIAPDLWRRSGQPGPHTPDEANQLWDETSQSSWLGFLPWLDFPKHLPKGLAEYAEDWLRHPNRTPWKFAEIHREVDVPNLDFSGWYDHCNDTMRHLPLMQNNGRSAQARSQTKLIAGPWNHPGLGDREVCGIDFGELAAVDKQEIIIRWFDHWLKGIANGVDEEPAVRYFVMGTNRWKSAPTWPPSHLEPVSYRLTSAGHAGDAHGDGVLELASGATDSSCESDSYTYDPRDPVPTLWSPEWFTAPADRRVLEHRQDILYYRSAPLTEPVEIAGYPEVVVFVSSTAPDTDFFARLVDEFPDETAADEDTPWYHVIRGDSSTPAATLGPAREICYGMVRARHRNSLDIEEFLELGEVIELRIEMGPTSCCFLPGHRLRLEITSSDFPNHDRNHNTGRNDLADTELVSAEQQIFHTPEYPSALMLPGEPA
jgi:hypothetical protein